jgi:prolyl-tRNA editing enzyme YbaK/EbsC (Cys-tRNA(Pro) deacylase)
LHPHYLDRTVVTCAEAATAKKIPPEHELKTLISETSVGVVAVHVPGNRVVALRAVKKALNCREARLASKAKLSSLGLAQGTVSPVLDPVWYMQHLVCDAVLTLGFVSTNNGTLTGYFKFSPDILLRARKVMRGSFSRLEEA